MRRKTYRMEPSPLRCPRERMYERTMTSDVHPLRCCSRLTDRASTDVGRFTSLSSFSTMSARTRSLRGQGRAIAVPKGFSPVLVPRSDIFEPWTHHPERTSLSIRSATGTTGNDGFRTSRVPIMRSIACSDIPSIDDNLDMPRRSGPYNPVGLHVRRSILLQRSIDAMHEPKS